MSGLERACLRALTASAADELPSLNATVTKCRPWASMLFTGTRLTVAVKADDDAALDAWLIALPERDLPLSRHFVADAQVIARADRSATIDLLVIED